MDCLILVGMQYMLHGRNGSFGVGTCRVYTFLPAALRDLRPSGTPSFVARRKIEEKGVPRGSNAAFWELAFHTGVWRGDVRRPYEFPPRGLPLGAHWCNLRDLGPSDGVRPKEVPLGYRWLYVFCYRQNKTPPPCNHGWLQALLPPDSMVLHVVRRVHNTH